METRKNMFNDEDLYPGVDIDIADDKKVTERLERERTETLDSNPRDDND